MRAALIRAIPIFFSARLMVVVFLPLVIAAIAWLLVAWWVWEPLVGWIGRTLFAWSGRFAEFAAGLVAAITLMLAAVASALVAIAVLAMPVIVELVAKREFPALERRKGGGFAGSLWNALGATLSFIGMWLLALPLLIFPPAWIVANLLLNANLNRRLLPYDALSEHADCNEIDAIRRSARRRLFILGVCIAPLSLVPVVNFFGSLFAGVAFTVLCLEELSALRDEQRDRLNAAAPR